MKPWVADCLHTFKQKYNFDNISAIIIDEVSMVKPWMLAYLDERLKEPTQNYNKPFGGIAVIMLGDFDQQPPIGGSSLLHLAIEFLKIEYEHKHHIFYTNLSRQKSVKINSTLCRRGVKIFQMASHLKLSMQHRCTNDPEHIENLNKMHSGVMLTPSDFKLYKTLSHSDFNNLNDFLYGTIIVTGNYERQELNASIVNLWAHHFNTHVVRWKNRIKYNKWSGIPHTDEEIMCAEKQSCFYEYFVPNCPAYLTHNVNLNANLANGTLVREHSLAFNSLNEKNYLDHLIKLTPLGGIIDLETPPTAINVELYPDFPCDDLSTTKYKIKKRYEWKHGSITSDGKVIVPIDKKTVKYHNESISACGTPFYLNASTVPMGDPFPIELGFCITIPKAQE